MEERQLDLFSTTPADTLTTGLDAAIVAFGNPLANPELEDLTRYMPVNRLDLMGGTLADRSSSNLDTLDFSYDIIHILDSILHALLTNHEIDAQRQLLTSSLTAVRSQISEKEWKACIRDIITPHPVTALIHQEPCTYRSFSKPRGYSGDAVMLDYLYRRTSYQDQDPIIKNLAHYVVESDAARSVRSRLSLLSQKIKSTLIKNPRAKILSVACGHCVEYELIDPDFLNALDFHLTAIDADKESLSAIKIGYKTANTTLINANLIDILKGKVNVGQFDLIYSIGIYDYLNDRIAKQFSAKLFDLLNPNGELLIANFANTTRDVGYMEAFMDWFLIYRTPEEMVQVVPSLFSDGVSSIQLFPDAQKQIVMTSIIKNGG